PPRPGGAPGPARPAATAAPPPPTTGWRPAAGTAAGDAGTLANRDPVRHGSGRTSRVGWTGAGCILALLSSGFAPCNTRETDCYALRFPAAFPNRYFVATM